MNNKLKNFDKEIVKNFCSINDKIFILTLKGHFIEINNADITLFSYKNEINFKEIEDDFKFKVYELPPISQMVQGYNHILLLDGIGNIYSLGDNKYGQLGLDDDINFIDKPEIVKFEKAFMKIFAFGNVSIGIERSGKYFVWGEIKDNLSNDCLFIPTEFKNILDFKTSQKKIKNKGDFNELDYFHEDEIISSVDWVIKDWEKEKKDLQTKIKDINKILSHKLNELKSIDLKINNYETNVKRYEEELRQLMKSRLLESDKRSKEILIKSSLKSNKAWLKGFKKDKKILNEELSKEKNKISTMNKDIVKIDNKINIFFKIIEERKVNLTKKNLNEKIILVENFLSLINKQNSLLKRYKIDEFILSEDNTYNTLDYSLYSCDKNLNDIKDFINNEKKENSHAFSKIFESIILLFETNLYYVKEYNRIAKTHLSDNNEYLNGILKENNEDTEEIKWGKNKVKGLYDKIMDLKNYFLRQN